MHTHLSRLFQTVTKIPVLREVLGAGAGCAIALLAYQAVTIGRGITVILALAAACAFFHRRMIVSEID